MLEKNKHVIYLPESVRIGKYCALGLEYGPRPRSQDHGHSITLYGPLGRQITYIYFTLLYLTLPYFTLLLLYFALKLRENDIHC